MSKRHSFVPAAPNYAALEDRIAPANIFGLGSGWDKFTSALGFKHKASNHGNTAIVEQAWKSAATADIHHAATVAHAKAHPAAAAKSPILFK